MKRKVQPATQGIESLASEFAGYPCNTEQDLGLKGLILGALYGLLKSAQLNYVHRTGPALPLGYEAELNKIAARFARGEAVNDGQWLAGFYFNSAMQRLAAGYYRGLQLLTGETLDAYELAELAVRRRLLTPDDINWLDTVHGEIQKLHRDRYGLLKGRAISLIDAVAAAHQLLTLAKRVRVRSESK